MADIKEVKVDFKTVADCIFKNKFAYKKLTDVDKEKSFFMINRKFACALPKKANYLNDKSIDKESAIDIWNNEFRKISEVPSWYWTKAEKVSTNKDFTKKEIEIFNKYNEEINPRYLDFVFKYFKDEVKQEVKFLSKFED